jgi:type 1 glutamine amidotransferase/HEAT repeat protein
VLHRASTGSRVSGRHGGRPSIAKRFVPASVALEGERPREPRTAWKPCLLAAGLVFAGCWVAGASEFGGTPQERVAAIQAAGYAKDASAVDALAKAALDADPAVAYAAAEALGAVGTEKAAESLLKAWASGSPATLANGLLRCAEARREVKDTARARTLYTACHEKGTTAQQAVAALGLAALDPLNAKPAPRTLELLRDEAEWTRLTGIHAAVRDADAATLPLLFELSMKPDESGRAATLALAAMAADGTAAFLYEEMKKTGPERLKTIELLSARGQPDLVQRLCDVSLYALAGVNAAAGGAFRTCVRQENFAQALAFVFGPLPSQQRDPLVSALASAAQQLPDQSRVMSDMGNQFAKTEAASKADLLGLLAGLQTEGARGLLVAQAKSDDVELRKAVVRVFAKWSSPLAVAPLLTIAKQDSERSVKILATRGLLALLQKSKLVEKKEQLALLAELAAVAERAEEKIAVYNIVKTMGGKEADTLRLQLAEACGATDAGERVVKAVNVGGPAVGVFEADSGFVGGHTFSVNLEADVSDAVGAAPEEVYQTSRYGEMSYTFNGLKAGQAYVLRMHFAEPFHSKPGRVCDVLVNGKAALADYDIFAKTGKKMKAVTERAEVTADAAGKLVVVFKTKRDHALVSGLEVLEAGGQRAEVRGRKTEAGGLINVLLMTGANNHNWQETTAALKSIFAESPKFSVTVVENPWDMKPADIEGFDLLFNNWNTYGKDKREWSAEMKAAFMVWVKKGGGFFVLHAGGSMFYDWEAFQSLTGGAWEKSTFHPHMQAFTVSIADKTHPVTRGMTDFETFDEPWQKIGNRNPSRRVLVSGVVSKENKGSGEPEPFAFVTELGKGRCFNLVLGHDAKALNNAGCKTLILRGSEWASAGDVK